MMSLRKRLTAILSILIAIVFFSTTGLHATDYKPNILDPSYDHTRYAPIASSKDLIIHFRAFTTCFDGDDDDDGDGIPDKWAIPHWVTYEIKRYPGNLKCPPRPPQWIWDRNLYEVGVCPKDESYHFSRRYREENPNCPQLGYDRGHLCMKNHACRLGDDADWNTHTVLNACPQKADLNQGIWLDQEEKTAKWADEYGSVWIITGPIVFNKKPTKWLGEPGEFPVVIPDAFFKVVVREVGGIPEALAFIYPQEGIGYKKR